MQPAMLGPDPAHQWAGKHHKRQVLAAKVPRANLPHPPSAPSVVGPTATEGPTQYT